MQQKGEPPHPAALTGYADNIVPISKYRYDERTNICMRFGMNSARKSSQRSGVKFKSMSPVGMSGGAILSWPNTLENRVNGNGLKLIGIVHTWENKIHTLCGTRMAIILGAIAKVHPDYFSVSGN